MRHQDIINKLSAYMDGELPLNERLEVENHIRAYPEIAEIAERLQREAEWLAETFDGSVCRTDFAPAILEKLGEAASDQIATVMLAKGRVEVRESDKDEWKPLINNSPVYPGEQVRTGTDGRTFLLLEDGSEVWVNKDTHLKFPKYIRDKRWFQILAGEFLAFFHKQRDPFYVATPAGRVEVVGTEFDIAVPDKNTTIISVVKGAVRYIGDLGERMIYKASQLKVQTGVELGESKPIRIDKFAPWARDLFAFAVQSDEKLGKVTKGRLQTASKGGDNGHGPQPPFFRMAFIFLIITLLFGGWNYIIRPMAKNRPDKQKITVAEGTFTYTPYSIDQGIPVRDENLVALQKGTESTDEVSEKKDVPSAAESVSTDAAEEGFSDPFTVEKNPVEGSARDQAVKMLEAYGSDLKTLQVEGQLSVGGIESISLEFNWMAPDRKRMAFMERSAMQEMLFMKDSIYQVNHSTKTYMPGRGVGFSEMLVLYCMNPMLINEFVGKINYNSVSESTDGKYYLYNVSIKPEEAEGNQMLLAIGTLEIRVDKKNKVIDSLRMNATEGIRLSVIFKNYKLLNGGFNIPDTSIIEMDMGGRGNNQLLTMSLKDIRINEYMDPESFDVSGKGWIATEQNPSSSVQRKALEKDPNDISAMYNLAKSNDVSAEEKVEQLEKALELSPDHPAIMLELGKALTDKGDDFAKAESILTKLLNEKPELQEAYIYLARAFEGQKKYQEGVAYFKNMITGTDDPKIEVRLYAPFVWLSWKGKTDSTYGFDYIANKMSGLMGDIENNQLLSIYMTQDMKNLVMNSQGVEDLEGALEKAVDSHKNNPFLQKWLAEVYLKSGKRDKAAKALGYAAENSKAISNLSSDVHSTASREGIKLDQVADEKEVEDVITRLKEGGNRTYQILNDIAKQYKDTKNYEGIVKVTEEFIIQHPQFVTQWSSSLINMGNYDPAGYTKIKKVFEDRAKIKPHAVYFEMLASIENRLNNYNGAARYRAEAIRFGNDGPDNYYQLSMDFRNAGNNEMAIQATKKAISLNQSSHYYRQLAQLYKKSGDNDGLRSMKNDVDTLPVGNGFNKGQIYNELGEYEKAYDLMMKWLENQPQGRPNQNSYNLREVCKAMEGTGKYSLPENVKAKYEPQQLADLMVTMIEQMMWDNKYKIKMIHLRDGNFNWNESTHNFPGAIRMLAELDAAGLADEVSDPEILQRIRGLLAHYSGDYATAVHYYSLLAGKELQNDQRYINNRNGRAIWIDLQYLLKYINGEGYETGNGTITGKLRFYGKPVSGMTVYAFWTQNNPNRWYDLRFSIHPCGREFYSYNNQNGMEIPPAIQTVTDAEGKFTFVNMPAGPYDFAFVIDNARLGVDDPEMDLAFMGSRSRITLGAGQNLDLGWFDIVKPLKILNYENYSTNVIYDDVIPLEWKWEAPPEVGTVTYLISASDIYGLDSSYYVNDRDIRENVGTSTSYDLSMEKFSMNGDYSIRIGAIGPDNRELSSASVRISIPKYEGLTSGDNRSAESSTYSFNNLWYSKKYQEYIDSVYDWLASFPTSTKADDALVRIAYAYDKLGEKDKAIEVIERFMELYPENQAFVKSNNHPREYDVVKLYADLTGADLTKLRDDLAERQAEAPREFLPVEKKAEMQAAVGIDTAAVSHNEASWFGAMLDKSAPWIIVFLMAISIMSFLQGLARRK